MASNALNGQKFYLHFKLELELDVCSVTEKLIQHIKPWKASIAHPEKVTSKATSTSHAALKILLGP